MSFLNAIRSSSIHQHLTRKATKWLSGTLACKRTFLSESYYCYDEWDKYLVSDVVKKAAQVTAFSIEIDKKLTEKRFVTPLDMDLLATNLVHITNQRELEFIDSIFLNFRKTQVSLYTRESMHYAFARSMLDIDQSIKLLQILKLKYKYGIFLSTYTANMLMDKFLKENDYRSAALAAHEVLLQEYNDNELTLAACLLSCVKYHKYLKDNNAIENESLAFKPAEDPTPKTKLLVKMLRTPYNDEHFDLDDPILLTGKTIHFAASYAKSIQPALKQNLKIFGLIVFKKYAKAVELLELASKEDASFPVYSFVIDELQQVADKQEDEKFLAKWNTIKDECLASASANKKELAEVIDDLVGIVNAVHAAQLPQDTKAQCALFAKWQAEQAQELSTEVRNFAVELKKREMFEQLEQLEKQEELLTFFDNQNKIVDLYFGRGFPDEHPSRIPVEPDESEFKKRAERHFKLWPKYANKPESYFKKSPVEIYLNESLKKVYLSNDDHKNINTNTSSSSNN